MRHDARLDGIRGLAVLAVMLFHADVLRGGSAGVDVFFVLSGWLITNILWTEIGSTGGVDIGAFLARRARRLMPALIAVLVIYAVLGPVLWPRFLAARWIDLTAAGLYLTNWREAFHPSSGPLAHTWSLAVEAQFYVVWPVVLMAVKALGRVTGATLLVLLWAVMSMARAAVIATGGDAMAYFATPLHCTGLLLGSALALRPLAAKPIVGWAALAALGGLAIIPHVHETFAWRLSLIELATAAVLMAPPQPLGWRPLAYLGMISYGVYLWHVPVWHALWMVTPLVRLMLYPPLALALAVISHHTLEAMFRRAVVPSPQPNAWDISLCRTLLAHLDSRNCEWVHLQDTVENDFGNLVDRAKRFKWVRLQWSGGEAFYALTRSGRAALEASRSAYPLAHSN